MSRMPSSAACRALALALLLLAGALGIAPRALADRDTPTDAAVAAEGTRLFEADRVPEAVRLLEAHVAAQPDARRSRLALAEFQRRRCALGEAERHLDHLLARNPDDAAARADMGELFLLLAQPEAALAQARLALATAEGRRNGRAWRTRALALVDLGRYEEALAAARQAVRHAPEDARTHEALARAAFRMKQMPIATRAYRRASRLDPLSEEAHLRLGSGFAARLGSREWLRADQAPAFRAAVAHWDAGRLAEATQAFRGLVEAHPDVFKYRLGLGLARRAMRHFHEVRFGGPAQTAWLAQPAPDVPALRTYVRGWSRLPAWAQRTIRISVAPARRWMPRLLHARASHEILALPDSLDDAPSRRHLRDGRTFDGRWYAHIRGVGGAAAATGIEKLQSATTFAFNTFAHEFAHQVLRQAFPESLKAEVMRLYVRARAEGRCLDYYAASNVDEYFAQGYEALVSHVKRGCQRDTARHTRDELRRRDPALHAFLLRHMDLRHETEHAMAGFWRALPP